MIKKLGHQTKMEFGTGDIGFNAGAIKEEDGKSRYSDILQSRS